jgi:hypothetical protein
MTPKKTTAPADISADPFHERKAPTYRVRMRLLGGDFEFETSSPELRRIVRWAYADLPRHRLPGKVPRFRVALALGTRRQKSEQEIPRIEMLSGADLLGATTGASDFVTLSVAQRAALIVVSRALLRSAYHVRYELIEFTVFTLAARAQGLMPLHAACVGRGDRGLLLMGQSGAGKSTAALQCLLRGLEFLSEDSVFVDPRSMLATGVANFLHVRRDALRFVPDATAALIRRSPTIRRRSGVEKFEVDLRRGDFRLAARPLEIVGTVFMTAQRANRRPLVSALRSADLMRRLQASQPYAASQPGWKSFRQRIIGLPAFELRRGRHPAEAAEAMQELVTDPGAT